MKKKLYMDLECYSDVDLNKCGVYKYAESDSFEILLWAFSWDMEPVKLIDLSSGQEPPVELIEALWDPSVEKWSHNVSFERICLQSWLSKTQYARKLKPEGWYCSMVWAATLGLPLSLKGVGSVLGLEKQKLEEGKDLIRYFCVPCKPTVSNNGRTRNLPCHAPEKWEHFKTYNIRDVETELEIIQKLSRFPVPDSIWQEFWLSEAINDRGIQIDLPLVKSALKLDDHCKHTLIDQMQSLTDLKNPNSVCQLKSWLSENGLEMDSLGKKEVAAAIKEAPSDLQEVLSLRLQLAKSSVRKYQAMENSICQDNRAHGMFQFYGANRTGRFSGKMIQLQNLPQNHLPDLSEARALVRENNQEALEMLYEDIPDTLSQLIRTAFIPAPGKKFIVADFSAIEARVLSWLAQEKWRMEVFASGKDIYCASASTMFGVPVEKHGVNGHLRQKGKQAELACIAEGQLVLTDHGLIPIEEVTKEDRVWDGISWVSHDGVAFQGYREVIEYQGLTATPDHMVYVFGSKEPVPFIKAAVFGMGLLTSEHPCYGGQVYQKAIARVYDIVNAGPAHRFTVSGKLVHNCGYGGSVGALKAMGALEMGLHEEELKPLVDAWRKANPKIVELWWDVDRCVKTTVQKKITTETHGITFFCQSGFLFITLPSGRNLAYVKPRMGENKFGGEAVLYEGIGAAKKWETLESYGPKFVENIIQGIARDILCYAMNSLRDYRIVAHVHDEVIIEADPETKLETVCELMGRTPEWTPGLLLRADGYECDFYRKD